MTSLLCIHFICFEQHTHKNLAEFARLKAVHLYKTFLHTGQSCQFARFRQFFKFIINFYKQPALWIIVLLALSTKVSTNNLCKLANFIHFYHWIFWLYPVSFSSITTEDQTYNIHFAYYQFNIWDLFKSKKKNIHNCKLSVPKKAVVTNFQMNID